MPSISKAQQSIMGQAWALRKGFIKINDIEEEHRKKIKGIAFGDMSDKELEDFASTKSEKLPDYVHKGVPYDSNIEESGDIARKANPEGYVMSNKKGTKKIYSYLDVDSKRPRKGDKNLQNLKDYRDWVNENLKNEFDHGDYKPSDEYQEELRRNINLDSIRKSKEYRNIIDLGFRDDTSHQQELNNTLKFVRTKETDKEFGKDPVFYTIHPTGVVRRYNPTKGEEIPQGSGNDIKVFNKPFFRGKDYARGLKYLFHYLRRKETRGDYR